MSFTGVSVISNGELVGGSYPAPDLAAGAASGYHLLVVEGHSRTRASPGSAIASRSFNVGGHSWCIWYYPDGYHSDDAGFISLELVLYDRFVNAQFEFSFVDETEKQEPARIRASRKMCRFDDLFSSKGHVRFVKRDALEKSKHFKDDSFTIRCDVLVAHEDVRAPPSTIEVPPSEMRENLTDLLLSGEGADVVFRVGGETVAAHRYILAARSDVFRALLLGTMKEGTSSTVVQIDDMDAAVFKALLGFIYGDSLPAPPSSSTEEEDEGVLFQHLLEAADRYGLPRLRAMCEKQLCEEHIGVSTATTILALAEQHGCNFLKEACYEFLRCPANLRAVVATDGFDHLCRSCPTVMKDLILEKLQAPN